MDIKIGDLVIFKKELYADEEGAVYRVLEINGDRCILEFVNTNMIIHPQSVAILSDLILFEGWKVIRVWEHELKCPEKVADKLAKIIMQG